MSSPSNLRRRAVLGAIAAVVLGGGWLAWREIARFPPDTTPEGAYLRIAYAIGQGDVRGCFAYLEERAQHAAFTLRDYRKQASERVAAAYPEPERTRLVALYEPYAKASDAADVWAGEAERRGWVGRLRRDLSGIVRVETNGERATVETARGTRYAFRKRENGIWGLAIFTAELVAEAERAARDWDVVQRAAADYERAK